VFAIDMLGMKPRLLIDQSLAGRRPPRDHLMGAYTRARSKHVDYLPLAATLA
jgi:hypothetical protein